MRGEPEVEDVHTDSRPDLGSVKITKRGEELPDGSQLVRMPDLERKVEDWLIELFVENPRQPRTDFDEESLEGLQESITAHGQLIPARAVPILLSDGTRKFLLIDGACRKRAREALGHRVLKAEIVYRPTMLKIFLESLEANTRQKTLNPMELARAYMKVVTMAREMGVRNSYDAAAGYLHVSRTVLANYISLLKLPEDVQRLVANGTIKVSDAFNLKRLIELNPGRPIEELIDLDARRDRRKGKRSGKGGGKGPLLDTLGAVGALKRGVGALGAFTTAAHDISALTRAELVDLIRDRSKQPPEEVVGHLIAGAERIAWLLDIAREAALPPPLPEIEGKPTFTEYVDSILDQIERDKHKAVLKLLAEASNASTVVYTVAEMSERLELEPWDTSAILAKLNRYTLSKHGLKIDTFKKGVPKPEREIRRRAERSPKGSRKEGATYKRVPGYRLAWADEPEPVVEQTSEPAPTIEHTPGLEPEPAPVPEFESAPASEPVVEQTLGHTPTIKPEPEPSGRLRFTEDGTPYRIMAVARAALEPAPTSAVELTSEPEVVVEADVPEDEDEPVEEVDDDAENEPVEEVDDDADDEPVKDADDEEAELARRIAARDAANVQFPDYVLEQLTNPNHPIHKLGVGTPFRLPEALAPRMEVYKLLPEGQVLTDLLQALGFDGNAWRQHHVLLYFEGGDVKKSKLRLLHKTAFNPTRNGILFPEDF